MEDEVDEVRQVQLEASGESQGVEEAELLDECGRTVADAAIVKCWDA